MGNGSVSETIYSLKAQSPLATFENNWPSLSIREIDGGELCSITACAGDRQTFTSIFEAEIGGPLPEPGCLRRCQKGFVFWSAPWQWFLQGADDDAFIDNKLTAKFGGTASITLQSDAWVRIQASGNNVRALLERLIMLDLSDEAFPPGSAARTQAHQINCFILRPPDKPDIFQFLCARSYSRSFSDMLARTATVLLGNPIE